MYSRLQLAKKYLSYYINSSNGKGHGVHSPFVFDLITNVLNDRRTYYAYETIERLRSELKLDNTLLTIEDFGAGSRVNSHKQRKVSSIAASALKPRKFAQLMFRMVNYYHPLHILELGTSLGITTAYLASGNSNANVTTMEGASAVAAIADQNFKKLQLNNVCLVQGNFDNSLPQLLREVSSPIDFAFIDGNHRKQPTLQYFQQLLKHTHEHSILIFDDVHWSEEMEEAWNIIKADQQVTLTIDLFFIGIVFFRKENKVKQHFSIRF